MAQREAQLVDADAGIPTVERDSSAKVQQMVVNKGSIATSPLPSIREMLSSNFHPLPSLGHELYHHGHSERFDSNSQTIGSCFPPPLFIHANLHAKHLSEQGLSTAHTCASPSLEHQGHDPHCHGHSDRFDSNSQTIASCRLPPSIHANSHDKHSSEQSLSTTHICIPPLEHQRHGLHCHSKRFDSNFQPISSCCPPPLSSHANSHVEDTSEQSLSTIHTSAPALEHHPCRLERDPSFKSFSSKSEGSIHLSPSPPLSCMSHILHNSHDVRGDSSQEEHSGFHWWKGMVTHVEENLDVWKQKWGGMSYWAKERQAVQSGEAPESRTIDFLYHRERGRQLEQTCSFLLRQTHSTSSNSNQSTSFTKDIILRIHAAALEFCRGVERLEFYDCVHPDQEFRVGRAFIS
jgi:hypothetical protein